MPSLEENKSWNAKHHWKLDGDEWSNQAAYCKKPYKQWKDSIVKNFIYKNINHKSNILEIGSGHGRWTEFLLNKCNKLIIVDLNPKCIEFCKNKFSNFKNIKYYANDGKTLDNIKSNSIDFIWSYDSFIHMEKNIIESYFKEFSRILKKRGIAIIHHPGRGNIALNFKLLRRFGKLGDKIYQIITINKIFGKDGRRSDISKEIIKKIARKNNLYIEYQINCWGKNKEYNNKLFNDFISKIIKK